MCDRCQRQVRSHAEAHLFTYRPLSDFYDGNTATNTARLRGLWADAES